MKLIILFALLLANIAFAVEVTAFVKLSPSGSFEAKTNHVTGRIVSKNGKLQAKKVLVPVDSLKTGIDLRDEHLKKYLKIKDHPYITLMDLVGENGVAKATINIAGVSTQLLKIDYSVDGKKLNANFIIDVLKFKLDEVKYFNIGVDNIIKINVKLDIDKK